MKTLCIVACHIDSDIKYQSLIKSRPFLEEISDDIIYINSTGCNSPFEMIYKENDKNKYWVRYIRELRDGVIDWENVRQSTREKYKLKYDEKLNKFISEIEPKY